MGHVGAAVLLGVICALSFVGARATLQAGENETTLRRICQQGNEQGTKQKQLWEFIITLSANDEPGDAERVEQFRAFLDDIYQPQECDK